MQQQELLYTYNSQKVIAPYHTNNCESLQKHLKTFYFQSAFPGAPSDPHTPAPPIQFLTSALYKFIYLLTYLLTY